MNKLNLTLVFCLIFSNQAYGECVLLPKDNIWNTNISNAPTHKNSQTWISSIKKNTKLHPDFGAGKYKGSPVGIPINYSDESTKRHKVVFRNQQESDRQTYPIPRFVNIEGGAHSDGDRHIIVVNKDECMLYELFNARRRENGTWTAGSGAVFDLASNSLRTDGWTSADAAGLPIFPGLVKYNETMSDNIKHALRFTLRKTAREYIWPARHFSSKFKKKYHLPPMGARFRLKSTVDISSFSTQAKIIARALKEYGMILADNGGDLFLSGEPHSKWSNWQLSDLKDLSIEDFEVVDTSKMQIMNNSGAANPNKLTYEIAIDDTPPKVKTLIKRSKNKAKYTTQFYVSTLGNDSNNGSFDKPWKTLQHASDLAEPGDTINVKKGKYQPFKISKKATKSKPIAFIADNAYIDAFSGRNRDGIAIRKASHIIIKGFKVEYAHRAGISAITCDHVTIEWNQLVKNKVWGIFTGFCDNLIISNNLTAKSKKQHGIYVSNTSTNISIFDNETYGNYKSGIQLNGDKNMGKVGLISHAKVYNNKIYNNGIRGGAAINLDGVQHSIFYNNTIYDNYSTGIAAYRIDGGEGSKFNRFYHNTIVMPENGRWCALFKNGSTHNRFINNICVNSHRFRGAINIDESSKKGFYSDYNVLTPRFTFNDGDSIVKYEQWASESANDLNSFLIDNTSDLFGFGLYDFNKKETMPLIRKGVLLEDIDENFYKNREITPNIGVIEQ